MKTLITIFLLNLTSLALADCHQEITDNYTHASRVFRLETEEMIEYDQLNESTVLEVLDVLLKRETSCGIKDVLFSEKPATCLRFPQSGITCHVDTSLGYFLVHRSSYGVYDHSIIFTIWD